MEPRKRGGSWAPNGGKGQDPVGRAPRRAGGWTPFMAHLMAGVLGEAREWVGPARSQGAWVPSVGGGRGGGRTPDQGRGPGFSRDEVKGSSAKVKGGVKVGVRSGSGVWVQQGRAEGEL